MKGTLLIQTRRIYRPSLITRKTLSVEISVLMNVLMKIPFTILSIKQIESKELKYLSIFKIDFQMKEIIPLNELRDKLSKLFREENIITRSIEFKEAHYTKKELKNLYNKIVINKL